MTEGNFRSIYYGADAAERGFPADDPTAFYLLQLRMLIVWPFDAEGFIKGEESYSAIATPDFFTKIDSSQVPLGVPRLHRRTLARSQLVIRLRG